MKDDIGSPLSRQRAAVCAVLDSTPPPVDGVTVLVAVTEPGQPQRRLRVLTQGRADATPPENLDVGDSRLAEVVERGITLEAPGAQDPDPASWTWSTEVRGGARAMPLREPGVDAQAPARGVVIAARPEGPVFEDDERAALDAYALVLGRAAVPTPGPSGIGVRPDEVDELVHELRAPLTVVSGYVSMILEGSFGEVPAPMVRPLGLVGSKADEARRTVEDLLLVARVDGGALGVGAEPTDLRQAARRAVARAQGQAVLHSGRVSEVEDPTGVGTVALADPRHVDRILDNLINNALVHGDAEPVVEVGVRGGERPALVVRDHGSGIPEAARGRIFERFGRVDDASLRVGSGLGLHIARRLAQAMHGSLELESTGPAAGSIFVLRLPAA